MTCYFILRSPYLPSNRLATKLDAESPLGWFQSLWPLLTADPAVLLGIDDLYGFSGFVARMREGSHAPANNEELEQLLANNWYSNVVEVRDGLVRIETDDDEVELAFWWVSEAVFTDEAGQFLIYATDALPEGTAQSGFQPEREIGSVGTGTGDGTVYAAFSTVWDSSNLIDLPGPVQIEGIRLPELAAWLATMSPDEEHPLEIDWLALIARSHPDLDLPGLLRRLAEVNPGTVSGHYQAIHAGTLTEEALRADLHEPGERERLVQVQGGPHGVELRFDDGFCHHVWFLFDDLWASAHPVLARSILRFVEPISPE